MGWILSPSLLSRDAGRERDGREPWDGWISLPLPLLRGRGVGRGMVGIGWMDIPGTISHRHYENPVLCVYRIVVVF